MWILLNRASVIGHNLSLICQMTSEDIKHQLIIIIWARRPCGRRGRKAILNLNLNLITGFRSCVKVEVAVLGSPSLTVLVVAVE